MAYTLQAKPKAYGGVFSILRTPAFSSHMQYTVRYQAKVSAFGALGPSQNRDPRRKLIAYRVPTRTGSQTQYNLQTQATCHPSFI